MRPAFRRGWEGEGKLNRRPGAGQRAKPATRGRLFCFGNERAKPLAYPLNQRNGAVRLPQLQRVTSNGPLARRDACGRCGGKQSADKAVAPSAQRRQSKRTRARRSHGKERGKSASGSVQNPAPSRSVAGKSATSENPAHDQRSVRIALQSCATRSSPQGRDGKVGSVQQSCEPGLRNRARCGLARRRSIETKISQCSCDLFSMTRSA